MTESHDPLEAELASLRPQEISGGLRQRVSERLEGPAPARPRPAWQSGRALAIAGGLVAAAAAVLLLVRLDGSRNGAPADTGGPGWPDAAVSEPALPVEKLHTLPSRLAYSRAIARSPEELDSLLDQHARLGSLPAAHESPVYAFTRSDDELGSFPGEL